MLTDFSARPWRVMHLLRPAEGGMRAQVAALISAAPEGATLLAAPPDVLRALSPAALSTLPLPEKIGGLRQQIQTGWSAGEWGRKNGATLLHAHGLRWLPLYVAAALRSRLPLVMTLHNMVPPPGELTPRERFALRVGLNRAARIIAVSAAVAASATDLVPGVKGRVRVIHNGIDLSRFSRPRDPARRAATRASLGIDLEASVVVCVARLAPEKNVGTLLEAIARLAPSFPALHLLLVGDGPWRPTLEHQARMLGVTDRASFAGMRADISDLLEASDLFCLPSQTEGLGIAAIEAMAAGLPAVVSRVGGLPEVVDDGITGLLVAPGDRVALARALAALLEDAPRAARMGEAGRARAHRCFDTHAMVTATHAVYHELTSRGSRS
jgi:glycosyltransferase involved in cell wall biosynthesis